MKHDELKGTIGLTNQKRELYNSVDTIHNLISQLELEFSCKINNDNEYQPRPVMGEEEKEQCVKKLIDTPMIQFNSEMITGLGTAMDRLKQLHSKFISL